MKILLTAGILLGAILFLACAPKQTVKGATEVVPLYDKEEPATGNTVTVTPVKPSDTTVTAASATGFRVQIFASASQDGAEKIAAQARTKFTDAVSVDYIYPYYKVRIGDCPDRACAETLKQKAISAGFYDAFVVPAQINQK